MPTPLTFSDMDRVPVEHISSFDMLVAPMSPDSTHDPLVMNGRLATIGSIVVTVNASSFEDRADFETLLTDVWLMGQLVAYTEDLGFAKKTITARSVRVESIMDDLHPEHIGVDVTFDDISRVEFASADIAGNPTKHVVSRKFSSDENEFIDALYSWMHPMANNHVAHVDLMEPETTAHWSDELI